MRLPSESKEQIALVNGLRMRGFFVFHIPNGMNTDARTGAQFKREGVVSGIPDLQIVVPNGKVIWVELKKRKGGVVSKAQKDVHEKLEKLGHVVILALGAKDAIEKLRGYIEF
jgi:hypothetical protein